MKLKNEARVKSKNKSVFRRIHHMKDEGKSEHFENF